MSDHCTHNLLVLRFCSSLLHLDCKFVWAQTCDGNMRVSLLQAKVWQHHLSQNIGYTIAGSARPAPPALSERNECVKETVLLKVQRSNFKSLWKKWGGPSHPSCPSRLSHSTSDGHDKGWLNGFHCAYVHWT